MIIPFKTVPFEEMKKKQAEQYYRWYMDKLDERVCRVQKHLELEDEAKGFSERMRYHVMENSKKLSVETVTIAWDIAAYFGEVVIVNNPQIRWGYLSTPKKLNGVNRPRLLGFAGDMTVYVYGRIEVGIWNSLDKFDKMRLYDMYTICEDMM